MADSLYELELAKFKNSISGKGSAINGVAIATLAAQGTGRRSRVVSIDASYSSSSATGLLTVKSGAVVIAEKYIHGAGAIDFPQWGRPAENLNEAISAELQAGGAGVTGNVLIDGFWHYE